MNVIKPWMYYALGATVLVIWYMNRQTPALSGQASANIAGVPTAPVAAA